MHFFRQKWKTKISHKTPKERLYHMTDYKRYINIFIIGAVGYCLIEILWRGYTHPTMAFVGGLCHVLIHIINKRFSHKPLFFRAFLCSVAISSVEFIAGLILNVIFRLDIWDYSLRPFNILGQICPLYSAIWFFLSLAILYFGNKYSKSH